MSVAHIPHVYSATNLKLTCINNINKKDIANSEVISLVNHDDTVCYHLVSVDKSLQLKTQRMSGKVLQAAQQCFS